jgi:hypothetical protein
MLAVKYELLLKMSSVIRSHLKNRILVQNRDGAEFQTAGSLQYFEDLKRGTNKEIGPKDIFEIASAGIIQKPPTLQIGAPPKARC